MANEPLTSQPAPPTPLAVCALAALEAGGIRYCVWKGSRQLAEGLTGSDDLDVLIDRSAFAATTERLLAHGFKQAQRVGGASTGMYHFYGFDPSAERLIHLHLYTRLFTGESLVQTHWFTLDALLLDRPQRIDGVLVADPSAELAVFVLRAMIKFGSLAEWAARPGLASEMRQKIQQLLPHTDGDAAWRVLREHCQLVDESLFRRSLKLIPQPGQTLLKVRLGRQIRRRLRSFERFGRWRRLWEYGRMTVGKTARGWRRARKRPTAGGLVVALVGADASGKSTLLSDLQSWLGPELAVRRVHVGKPPATWMTRPLAILLPLARHLWPGLRARARIDKGDRITTDLARQPTMLEGIRAVMLAWDRHQLVRRVRRHAAAGDIVLCDRYTSTAIGAMDSPRLPESIAPGGRSSRLLNRFARWERHLYAANPAPDLVIKLTVAIEVAQRRNAERQKSAKHTTDELTARHLGFRRWTAPHGATVLELDTGAPFEQTRMTVRNAVWKAL